MKEFIYRFSKPSTWIRAVLLILIAAVLGACTKEVVTPVPLPTAKVPSLLEINGAADFWHNGNNLDYFVVVEETTPAGTSRYRIVVSGGNIRAAQRMDRVDQEWQPPFAIDFEIAELYTIDALFERILRDASGQGSAPLNMIVVFDNLSGFPTLVEAKALPSYTGDGRLDLNREDSYTLSISVNTLLEDTFGLNRTPLLTLNLSGGTEAWCSTLRIFPDGTSIYSDDCRQTLLQLRPPQASFERLQALAAELAPQEDSISANSETRELVFTGTGSASANQETLAEIWDLALSLNELLSRPIGVGVTLLLSQGENLIGFDMQAKLEQTASFDLTPPFYGGVTDQEGILLIYGDGNGLKWLDTLTGDSGKFFSNPTNQWLIPTAITVEGKVILKRLTGGTTVEEWGWVSLSDRSWHPLPDVGGCIEHISSNRVDDRILVSTRVDAGCNSETALWVIDLALESAEPVISASFNAVSASWSPDGEWLAVVLEDDASDSGTVPTSLYRLRPSGSGLTALTGNALGRVSSVVWSLDGLHLYYGITGAENQENGLYEFNLAENAVTRSLSGENLQPIAFDPSGEFLAFLEGEELQVWVLSFGQIVPVTQGSGANSQFIGWIDSNAGN